VDLDCVGYLPAVAQSALVVEVFDDGLAGFLG